VFDQGTPAPLRSHLSAHQVSTAFELNWGTLKNGELLSKAEAAGFEVLVTTDQNLRYQQNLSKRRIAVVVIGTTSWPRIKKGVAAVVDAVNGIGLGGYVEVPIP
jgi:NAD(P)H-hydrate repair Nnr-like enzyme with NAD(P)H-hydrate epimerase domain